MATGPDKRKLGKQGIMYLLVGGASALIEVCIFELLYAVAGIPIEVANPIALVVSTVFNFLLNRNVTFGGTTHPARSMLLFVALWLFNMVVTTTLIGVFVGAGINSSIAKLMTQAMVAIWDFFLYRKFIFV